MNIVKALVRVSDFALYDFDLSHQTCCAVKFAMTDNVFQTLSSLNILSSNSPEYASGIVYGPVTLFSKLQVIADNVTISKHPCLITASPESAVLP